MWVDRIEGLAALEAETRRILGHGTGPRRAPAGTVLFAPGASVEAFVLLLDGTVRVQRVSESGRQIVRYRIEPGESCILTTSCLIGGTAYTAEGVAERDIEAVALPRPLFERALVTSPVFRRFVFDAFARRVADLFHVIDEIAFRRVDLRLADRLLARAGEGSHVAATHQALAEDLGTAREVVSR